MSIEIQFQLKNNPNYQKYLRENSHWYKILNRDPTQFNNFISEVKEKYKLRATDKVAKVLEGIELVQSVLSSLT